MQDIHARARDGAILFYLDRIFSEVPFRRYRFPMLRASGDTFIHSCDWPWCGAEAKGLCPPGWSEVKVYTSGASFLRYVDACPEHLLHAALFIDLVRMLAGAGESAIISEVA